MAQGRCDGGKRDGNGVDATFPHLPSALIFSAR
jgi:hypothetical protein